MDGHEYSKSTSSSEEHKRHGVRYIECIHRQMPWEHVWENIQFHGLCSLKLVRLASYNSILSNQFNYDDVVAETD